jgi:cytochrome c-type biogenesis protein CcmH/NrfF
MLTPMRRTLVLLGIAMVLFGCGRPAQTPAERARSIEAEVWSPYCPGRLLVDCTTTQARELRADIQERIERGDDEADVIRWVRSEFGDEAIARPVTGAGVLIWIVPVLIFVIGAAVVFRVVRPRAPTADASSNA